jgi:hypothetical protein
MRKEGRKKGREGSPTKINKETMAVVLIEDDIGFNSGSSNGGDKMLTHYKCVKVDLKALMENWILV